jgi:hypothetical protein
MVTLLDLILASGQPMFLVWGLKRTWFYNDAFIPIAGRMLAVDMLEDLGFRTLEAADGPSGLRLLNEYPEIKLLFALPTASADKAIPVRMI